MHRSDSIPAGRVYQNVPDPERRGVFPGETLPAIPQVTRESGAFPRDGGDHGAGPAAPDKPAAPRECS